MISRFLGPDPREERVAKSLGRTIRWTVTWIQWIGDQPLPKDLLCEMGLDTWCPVRTPGVRREMLWDQFRSLHELNAAVKAGVEGKSAKILGVEIAMDLAVMLFGDSTAAQGTISRYGSGKEKPLGTNQLWLQEQVVRKEFTFEKIPRAPQMLYAFLDRCGWANSFSAHEFKYDVSMIFMSTPRGGGCWGLD